MLNRFRGRVTSARCAAKQAVRKHWRFPDAFRVPQLRRREALYQAATNAVESQGRPFTLADADTGTQRRIGTNVSKLASRLSGGE